MRKSIKKAFFITLLCIQNYCMEASEKSGSLLKNLSKPIIGLALVIVSSSLCKIGGIYFEQYLNKTWGIKTTPDMPTLNINHTFESSGNVKPTIIDNREKPTEDDFDYKKMICNNGSITGKYWYDIFKEDSKFHFWYSDSIQKQKPRRLNEDKNNKITDAYGYQHRLTSSQKSQIINEKKLEATEQLIAKRKCCSNENKIVKSTLNSIIQSIGDNDSDYKKGYLISDETYNTRGQEWLVKGVWHLRENH